MALVVWISLYRVVQRSADSQVFFRILLTYLQTSGTLASVYFARGTAEFRALFGFTTAVGDSPLSLTPLQCTLRIPFYARFGITVSLPFSIAVLVLITNLAALALARLRGKVASAVAATVEDGAEEGKAATAASAAGAGGGRAGVGGGGTAASSRHQRPYSPVSLEGYGRALAPAITKGGTRSARSGAAAAGTGVLVVVGADSSRNGAAGGAGSAGGTGGAGDAGGAGGSVAAFFALVAADVRRFFATQAWVAPVIFVLNASYSSLTTTSFGVFNCMPFSVGGVTYLAQDLSVTCYDSVHNGFRGLAGVLIAFFGAGFPLLFAALLRRHRTELHRPRVFARLGFLYDGYAIERSMYAWESVVMVRKAAVVMIGSLIKDAYQQIFASVALLIVALFLQAFFQPYAKRAFNLLECTALVVVMLTQLMSMFFLRSDSLSAQCEGQSDVFVVDAQGTTCAEVSQSARTSAVLTTAGMALLNIAFLAVSVSLTCRLWSAEAAKAAPTGLVALGLRAASRKLDDLKAAAGLRRSRSAVVLRDGPGPGGSRRARSSGASARLDVLRTANPLLQAAGNGGGRGGSGGGGGGGVALPAGHARLGGTSSGRHLGDSAAAAAAAVAAMGAAGVSGGGAAGSLSAARVAASSRRLARHSSVRSVFDPVTVERPASQ